MDNSGLPPRVAELGILPGWARKIFEARQVAYWFPTASQGKRGGFIIAYDCTLFMLLPTALMQTWQRYDIGHLYSCAVGTDPDDENSLILDPPGVTLEFDSAGQAAHVRAVLEWASRPENAPVLRGPRYDRILRCTYLGGAGLSLKAEEPYDLVFSEAGVAVHSAPASWVFPAEFATPLNDIVSVNLGGPGAVTTGGGFYGGGFGVLGAVKGIAAADLLNRLTTKTKIWSTISVTSNNSEGFFLNHEMVPSDLRIALSQFYLRLDGRPRGGSDMNVAQSGNTKSVAEQLEQLADLHASGLLDAEEFAAAKRAVLGL